ncbi:vacuolar ATPase assembly integral membrane protein vma21-like [Astyanax mexicanus]|uniref:Vacuolar ATPase assembly integral membrane protein vma21-like n=1 Tax=Astyanax mexicanus TaxID=7994 RepID=A0A8T2LRD7_ASTMX|nr:vacuolar ATPase assembly integral membrane protein vma21-like [Astyanax mexicanus]
MLACKEPFISFLLYFFLFTSWCEGTHLLPSEANTSIVHLSGPHLLFLLLFMNYCSVILKFTIQKTCVFFRNDGSLVSALKTLLFFTVLMVTVPIGLYFASKSYIFEGLLQMSNTDSYFYAAIVAVLAVHVVLALFVYVAWTEGSPQKKKGKHD